MYFRVFFVFVCLCAAVYNVIKNNNLVRLSSIVPFYIIYQVNLYWRNNSAHKYNYFETLFHTLAFHTNFSRIFHPCNLVPQIHVSHFQSPSIKLLFVIRQKMWVGTWLLRLVVKTSNWVTFWRTELKSTASRVVMVTLSRTARADVSSSVAAVVTSSRAALTSRIWVLVAFNWRRMLSRSSVSWRRWDDWVSCTQHRITGRHVHIHHGPDLQTILRQSYDYLTIMPNLRSTYDRRLIYNTEK